MYSIAGTDFSIFGFIPMTQPESDIALSGFLDMPQRLLKTGHDWAGEKGIEPYVSASEIFFGGRSLKLEGVIQGTDANDLRDKVDGFHSLINSFTALVSFTSPWSTHNVMIDGAVTGDKLAYNLVKVSLSMREPVVNNPLNPPVGTNSEFGIDGVSFADLGGFSLQLSGDRFTRPAPKKDSVSVYGKEAVIIAKPEVEVLNLKLVITANNPAQLSTKVLQFAALLAKPGLRELTYEGDKLRAFFVKDGFTVSQIHMYSEPVFCVIDVKLTDGGEAGTFASLFDTDLFQIMDTDGNSVKILI